MFNNSRLNSVTHLLFDILEVLFNKSNEAGYQPHGHEHVETVVVVHELEQGVDDPVVHGLHAGALQDVHKDGATA